MERKLSGRRGFRSLFVEPYRQIKLGLMFVVVNFVFSILIFGVFGYYFFDVYQTLMTYFHLSPGQGTQILEKLSIPLFVAAGLMVLFIVITIFVSVMYTHAIYGPLVSIHRFLDDLLSGSSMGSLSLRESDQLKDLAMKLNKLAERMGEQRKSPMVAVHKFLDTLIEGGEPEPLSLRESDQLQDLVAKLNKISLLVKGVEKKQTKVIDKTF